MPLEVVVGLDQAPTHVGWSVLDFRRDGVVRMGGEAEVARIAKKSTFEAARYVTDVLDELERNAEWQIRAVAVEGAFYGPSGWKIAEELVELRGRILADLERRGLSWIKIEPHEWQVFLGIRVGTKSEDVKLASVNLAKGFVPKDLLGGLTEDIADSVNIARCARGKLLERELGERQRRLM